MTNIKRTEAERESIFYSHRCENEGEVALLVSRAGITEEEKTWGYSHIFKKLGCGFYDTFS